jgi:hypothetical protein
MGTSQLPEALCADPFRLSLENLLMDETLKQATQRLKRWVESDAPSISMQQIWPHPSMLRQDILLLIKEVEKK